MAADTMKLFAPNLISVCIDRAEGESISGRLYHCYEAKPRLFVDTANLLVEMESVLDLVGLPQNATRSRFLVKKKEDGPDPERPAQVYTQEEVFDKRGEVATLTVHIKYRQNATWQGRAVWREKQRTQVFRSEIEFLKFVQTVISEE